MLSIIFEHSTRNAKSRKKSKPKFLVMTGRERRCDGLKTQPIRKVSLSSCSNCFSKLPYIHDSLSSLINARKRLGISKAANGGEWSRALFFRRTIAMPVCAHLDFQGEVRLRNFEIVGDALDNRIIEATWDRELGQSSVSHA